MRNVLIRDRLSPAELKDLEETFPHFTFQLEGAAAALDPHRWEGVEVIYGTRLNAEELDQAHRLRWVHTTHTSLDGLCHQKMLATGRVRITNSPSPDSTTIGEYVIGASLSFSKNFFDWKKVKNDPKEMWENPFRDIITGLRGRTLLQIGLDTAGTEITRTAQLHGMRTWGVTDPPSFHPHCTKVFPTRKLHSLLPSADVISIGSHNCPPLDTDSLNLIKGDAILIFIGKPPVDQRTLYDVAKTGKFRGIAIDGKLDWKGAPLWELPNVLITPEIAELPESESRYEFRLFLHNFRRYIHNDFEGMKHLIAR